MKNTNDFNQAKIILEKYFIKKRWHAEVLIDPYTNHPFITTIIKREFAVQFLDTARYMHPNGAWQYFKNKYFPYWLKKYFPVKLKIIEFSFKAVFPNYKPPNDEWKSDVRFMVKND